MLYLHEVQPSRSRKGRLVPLTTINGQPVKIEVVDMEVMEEDYDIMAMSPESSSSSTTDETRPRKRAKLDHMSAEEKSAHRKKMNRISAQSARDRQKALMAEQVIEIEKLKKEKQQLENENQLMKKKHLKAVEENERMSKRVCVLESRVLELEDAVEGSKVLRGANQEPAVPVTVPLQKGPFGPLNTLALIFIILSFLRIQSQQSASLLSAALRPQPSPSSTTQTTMRLGHWRKALEEAPD